jgi:hypothetical protein
MTCKYGTTLGGCDEHTVNSCVRLGECPSAETMVGVLERISQSESPVGEKAITNWQGRKAVRR